MPRPKILAVLIGVGALLCVLPPGCALSTGSKDELPIWQRIDLPSVTACAPCHLDVYEEWAESLHHGAWSNDNVLGATDNFERRECRACHSPLPVLPRGLDRRPKYRDFNQADGVHCLSCHGMENGVAAARDIEGAPCRPRYEPRLLQAELCYPCHEPTHQAFAEYRTSDAAATGVRCVDCHMQPTTHRRGRSHGPHGGFNAEFVKRAISYRCELVGDQLRVELRNRCGHKFPGEIPSRSFLVQVRMDGARPLIELLRRSFKTEKSRRDNRLLPDETRVLKFQVPEGTKRVTVRLLFKPLPLMADELAFVLGTWDSTAPR